MFKKLLGLFLCLTAASALADSGAVLDLQNRAYFVAKDGYNMTIGTSGSGETFTVIAEQTPVMSISGSKLSFSHSDAGINDVPYVATPATNLTPAYGTNDFRRRTYIAAAGPTAQAVALPNSPSDGDTRVLVNLSANPLIVASMSTPKINSGTNRTTSVAAKAGLRCNYSSSLATWVCDATGALPTPIGG